MKLPEKFTLESPIIEISNSDPTVREITMLVHVLDEPNLNGLKFTETYTNQFMNTLINKPVVCEYYSINDDLGDHAVYYSDDGQIELRTIAIGTINKTWIDSYQINNEIKKALFAKAVVWSYKYPQIMNCVERLFNSKKGKTSVEIEVYSYEDGGTWQLRIPNDYTYLSNCILGRSVQPADPNAGVINVFQKEVAIAINQDLNNLELNLAKDQWGTGDSITIDNSAASVSTTAWGSINKTKLRNDVLKASNYKDLIQELYLKVDAGWEDNVSSSTHYPHHVISNGKLVISKTGCIAARQRWNANESGDSSHLKRHYKVLGLPWNEESSLESGDKVDNKELFNKGKEIIYHQTLGDELSYDDIRDQIYNILNPVNPETDMRSYNYWIRELFQSYVIVEDWNVSDDMYKINYTVSNNIVTIDSKEQWIAVELVYQPKGTDIQQELNQKKEEIEQLNTKIEELNNLAVFSKEGSVKLEEQIKELEAKIEQITKEFEVKIAQLEQEKTELSEYKTKWETKEKENKIKEINDKYSKLISEEVFKSEEIQKAISELNESILKDAVIAEMQKKMKEKELEVNSKKDDVILHINPEGEDLLFKSIKEEMYASSN